VAGKNFVSLLEVAGLKLIVEFTGFELSFVVEEASLKKLFVLKATSNEVRASVERSGSGVDGRSSAEGNSSDNKGSF